MQEVNDQPKEDTAGLALLKAALSDTFTIHRNSRGPVALVGGKARVIFTKKMKTAVDLSKHLVEKGHTNICFYKKFGEMIRFCSW